MKKLNLLAASLCFLLLLTITGTFSCKKSSSDNSNRINVSGNWKGNVFQNADGIQAAETDTIALSLAQSGTNITGSFTKNGTTPSMGTVSGTINGSNIAITCTSASNSNPGGANLKGTVNSNGNSMIGSYTSLIGTDAGTWNATKQ